MARPQKEINWEVVEKRAEAGCSGREIAASLRIDDNTFYSRFKQKYGKSFQDYSGTLYSVGDANIRALQYAKAMSGNINMLFFLGKERLGQGKEQEKVSPFEDIIDLRHENMILKAALEKYKEDHANKS